MTTRKECHIRGLYKVFNGIAIGAVTTFVVNFAVGDYLGWVTWFTA